MQIASFQNLRLTELVSKLCRKQLCLCRISALFRNGLNCVADEVLLSSIVIFPPLFYLQPFGILIDVLDSWGS
jgi:hypothetical protein